MTSKEVAQMAENPEAALRRVIAQCDGVIIRLAKQFKPPIVPPAIHKWLTKGRIPSGNAPQLERISRERVAALGLSEDEVVLVEYLCPEEPWHVIRGTALTPAQVRMVSTASRNEARRQAERAAAAKASEPDTESAAAA